MVMETFLCALMPDKDSFHLQMVQYETNADPAVKRMLGRAVPEV